MACSAASHFPKCIRRGGRWLRFEWKITWTEDEHGTIVSATRLNEWIPTCHCFCFFFCFVFLWWWGGGVWMQLFRFCFCLCFKAKVNSLIHMYYLPYTFRPLRCQLVEFFVNTCFYTTGTILNLFLVTFLYIEIHLWCYICQFKSQF